MADFATTQPRKSRIAQLLCVVSLACGGATQGQTTLSPRETPISVVVDIEIVTEDHAAASQAPSAKTGVTWKPLITGKATPNTSAPAQDINKGVGGKFQYIWAGYQSIAPSDVSKKVVSGLYATTESSCGEGYEKIGTVMEDTRHCSKKSVCVATMPMMQALKSPKTYPINSLYLAWRNNGASECPPLKYLLNTAGAVKDVTMDLQQGCENDTFVRVCSYTSRSDPVAFGVYGDMPYTYSEKSTLVGSIVPKLAAGGFDFVANVGDFGKTKTGVPPSCGKDGRTAALSTMTSIAGTMTEVFYTPGDNDWADCYQYHQTPGMAPPESSAESLKLLHEEVIDKVPLLLENPYVTRIRQSGQTENMRWLVRGVVFSSFHIISSNNGYLPDINVPKQEIDARQENNVEWLKAAFDSAADNQASALVLFFHADLWSKAPGGQKDLSQLCLVNPAYSEFCRVLESRRGNVLDYSGPILLVHGDTPAYCLDKPIPGDPNIWRLNVPGDTAVIDANAVTINPGQAVPFAVSGVLGNAPASTCAFYTN